jgi:hypothetical protein
MKTVLRNSLAVIIGLVVGSALNMLLVTVAPYFIPPPPGVDVNDVDSIAASIHLYGPEQFIFPFLAHALGTLVGALVAYLVGISHQVILGYIIGVAFLAGGVSVIFMIPTPLWYTIIDLGFAYLPMAWLGIQIGKHLYKDRSEIQ